LPPSCLRLHQRNDTTQQCSEVYSNKGISRSAASCLRPPPPQKRIVGGCTPVAPCHLEIINGYLRRVGGRIDVHEAITLPCWDAAYWYRGPKTKQSCAAQPVRLLVLIVVRSWILHAAVGFKHLLPGWDPGTASCCFLCALSRASNLGGLIALAAAAGKRPGPRSGTRDGSPGCAAPLPGAPSPPQARGTPAGGAMPSACRGSS